MSDEQSNPRYGFGKYGRPLWSERDRDAEGIRLVLRRARYREWREDWGGFVVEGGEGGSGFAVACAAEATDLRGGDPVAELDHYREALAAAGYLVQRAAGVEDGDRQVLRVWPPAGARRGRIGWLRRLL